MLKRLRLDLSCGLDGVPSCSRKLHLDDYLKDTPEFPTVVGMLLRARTQNLVDFDGEMLFQRRDVYVVITFLCMPEDIQNDSDAVLEYFCKTSPFGCHPAYYIL